MKSQGLSNPAIAVASSIIASSPQGQQAIGNGIERLNKASGNALGVGKNIFWLCVFGGLGYWGYKTFVNRFVAVSQNNDYTPATLSVQNAKTRAEKIYKAMYGVGNGFDVVLKQIKDLKHNDFIRVYNAFGNRKGINPFGDKMNLIEWFNDQFEGSELVRLRFEIPNFF